MPATLCADAAHASMRKKQLSLDFTVEEERHAPNPEALRRREVFEATQVRGPKLRIQRLLETEITADEAQARELLLIQAICAIKRRLRDFVDNLVAGKFTKNKRHRQDAIALRREFDTLPEMELADRLKKLGLCKSTRKFWKRIGVFRYVLLDFRKAMIQAGLWPDPSIEYSFPIR